MNKLLIKFLFLTLFIGLCDNLYSATITANAAGGEWKSGSTWVGGIVPSTGDIAIIPVGTKVTYSITDNSTLGYEAWNNPVIEVYGTLEFFERAGLNPMGPRLNNTADITVYPGGTFLDNLFANTIFFNAGTTTSISINTGAFYKLGPQSKYTTTEFVAFRQQDGGNGKNPFQLGNKTGPYTVATTGVDLSTPTGTPAARPTTITGSNSISAGSTTLNGTVSDNGASTTISFDYGTNATLSGSASVSGSPATIATNGGTQNVAASVTNLSGGTKYYYRVKAVNSVGTNMGAISSFTTPPSDNATLSALTISTGSLSPVFTAGTTSYSATVPSTVTQVTVTPTVADVYATVKVNGNPVNSASASSAIALVTGNNTITTVVTAQNGTTTQTYTLNINRALSNDATLSALVLSSGTLSPAFNPQITSSNIIEPNTSGSIAFTPTATQPGSTIAINGKPAVSGMVSDAVALNAGNNYITISVTAPNGTTKQSYTVVVKGIVALNNAGLTQNTIPATAYSLRRLSGAFTGKPVTVRRSSDNATLDIGFDNSGNIDTAALKTFVGTGSAYVYKWADQSGSGNDLYQSTAALQPRIVNAGVIEKINNRPALYFGTANMSTFKAAIFPSATSMVGFAKGNSTTPGSLVTKTGTAAGANNHYPAPFDFTNTNGEFYVGNASNTSGGAVNLTGASPRADISSYVPASVYSFVIPSSGTFYAYLNGTQTRSNTVSGYADNGNTMMVGNRNDNGGSGNFWTTELVMFNSVLSTADRQTLENSQKNNYKSNDAALSNLAISSGTLSPVFAAGTTSYTVNVTEAISSITLTPLLNNIYGTVKVNGTVVSSGTASGAIALNEGPNTFTVLVTAQDGITTQTYTVAVNRTSSNATLSALSISKVTLSPQFSSLETDYSYSGDIALKTITVTPVAASTTASIQVKANSSDYVTLASGSSSAPFNVIAGNNLVEVLVTASNGNTKLYSVKIAATVPAPVITSFTPTNTGAGSSVVITGTDLTSATSVTFGGVAALSFTVNSDTQITAVVPSSAPSGDVGVTNPGGTGTLSGFTFISAPRISYVSPMEAGANTLVYISGDNLAGATSVSLGGVQVRSFYASSGSIQFNISEYDQYASGDIKIITPGGTVTKSGFVFVPPPSVYDFSPRSAYEGEYVTITGNNFKGITSVRFGNTPAASFVVNSTSQITAKVGAGASGRVKVSGSYSTYFSGEFLSYDFTFRPKPTITSFTPGTAGPGLTVVITGADFTNVSSVSFGGVAASSFTINSDTQITAVVPSSAPSGDVGVTNPGGTSTLSGFTFISAPRISYVSPMEAGANTLVYISGDNLAGATSVSLGGVQVRSFYASSGSIQFNISEYDQYASGDIKIITPGGTVTKSGFVFVQPPVIYDFNPRRAYEGEYVTITGNNFKRITQVSFGGTAAASFIVDSPNQITAKVGAGSSGRVKVSGSYSTYTSGEMWAYDFTFRPKPTITSFTPVSAVSGSSVVITGANLSSVSAVSFGGVAASFTVNSDTQITAVVPELATSGNVSVKYPAGTVQLGGFTFTYPLPVISSFTPATANVSSTVVITGVNFTAATGVSFGGVAAASFTIDSDTQITATLSPLSQSGDVGIANPSGTGKLAGFVFVPAPTIASFTPSAGLNRSVVIAGTNFTGATAVSFGGVAARSFVVNSDIQITAILASGQSGDISVITPGGTATLGGFTFIPPPTITFINPTTVRVGGTVIISGTNLSTVTSVKFRNIEAESFAIISSNIISAKVARGSTSGVLTVTTLGGSAVRPVTILQPPAPNIESFTPVSANAGSPVIITGSNFTGATTVSFGGVAAESFMVNSSTQITAVPGALAQSGSVSVTTPDGTGTLSGFVFTRSNISISGSLTALNTTYGTASASQQFTVTQTDIETDVTITAPEGFEVSTDNSSYSRTQTIPAAQSASTTIYIRLAATTAAGDYAGTVTIASGSLSQSLSTNSSNIVDKAPLTITADAKNKQYGAADPALTYTITAGSLYNGDTFGGVLRRITGEAVGSYAIQQGTLSVNSNYAITYVSSALAITPLSQSIVFEPLADRTYGEMPFFLRAAAGPSGNPVVFTSSNPSVVLVTGNNMARILGAGTAVITATQAGDASSSAATPVSQTLTVNKATVSQTLGNLTQAYSGRPLSPTVNAGSAPQSGISITYNGSSTVPTAAGTYAVEASLTHINYKADKVSGTFTISPSSQSIVFEPLADRTYGEMPFFLRAAAGPSGNPVVFTSSNPSVVLVTGNNMARILGAGTAVITATQAGDASSSAATPVSQTLTVNKATVSQTLGNLTQAYSGRPLSPTVNAGSAPQSGISITYNGSSTVPTAAGTYAVEASLTHINYKADKVSGTFTISPSSQSIVFEPLADRTYGEMPFFLRAAAGPSGNPVVFTSSNPSVVLVTGNNMARILGAGTAVITATQAGDASSSAATPVSQTLTVNKATVTLTLGNLTQAYSGRPLSPTVNAGSAPQSGISITYNGSSTVPTAAGTYAVEASLTHINYKADKVSGTFTISPSSQSIVFEPLADRTYGEMPFFLRAAAGPSGNPVVFTSSNPSVVLVTGNNMARILGAGTAVITATQAGDASSSAATPVSQTLTVNKATVTLTLGNLTQAYSGKATGVTVTTNPAKISGVMVTYNGSSAVPVAAGAYEVEANLNNPNYRADAVTGVLAISPAATLPTYSNFSIHTSATKADQNIQVLQIPKLTTGDNYDLSQIATTSGLPPVFASSNNVVASVTGNILHANSSGEITLTITQPGDQMYNEAAVVKQVVTVEDKTSDSDIRIHQAVSPNGDGMNDVLFIEDIEKYANNKVTVMNRNGMKVFEMRGYDNHSRAFDGRSSFTRQMQLPGTYFFVAEYDGKRVTGWFVLKY